MICINIHLKNLMYKKYTFIIYRDLLPCFHTKTTPYMCAPYVVTKNIIDLLFLYKYMKFIYIILLNLDITT